jgi:cytochrome bd-type quinol oxidase subunit 2
MLQRIQSVYLLIVTFLMAGLPFWITIWTDLNGKQVYASDEIWILIAFIASALLAFATIFIFKNRKLQFVLNRLNIILNVTLLGFFVYRSLNLSGENEISEKGIGMFIPVISIVFLVLANKAIKKDEDLVKSVDRLR